MLNTTKRISTKTRKAVYKRDDYACVLCNDARTIHLHHFIPRGKGGSDNEANLVCLCPTCHRVVHGDYAYSYDFPFDAVTANDAIYYYLNDYYKWDSR